MLPDKRYRAPAREKPPHDKGDDPVGPSGDDARPSPQGIQGLSDDLGSQRGPLFSPGILHEFFVPEYKRLTSLYREHGVLVFFHSCGGVEPVTDVFLEIGIDVLNPVQASANDLDALRGKTMNRIALHGGVSTHTIMTGPVEKIEAEVRMRLWQLGSNGGYFCAPDQGLPFPEPHVRAFHAAVEKYGVYPISCPDARCRNC